MANSTFNHEHFLCHSSDDGFGVIEEVDDKFFEVDSSRSKEGAFSFQESIKRVVTLEAKSKIQATLIEELKMENKYLKKLLQILEERECPFK